MSYKKDEKTKKETFEQPKMVDLAGKEISDEELEGAAGGQEYGHDCNGGTGNDCNGGSSDLA